MTQKDYLDKGVIINQYIENIKIFRDRLRDGENSEELYEELKNEFINFINNTDQDESIGNY